MIFHDPSGRRKRWLLYAEVLLIACGGLLAAAVVFSLADVNLPGVSSAHVGRPAGQRRREKNSRNQLDVMRLELLRGLTESGGLAKGAPRPQDPPPIVAAFFSPGPEAALDALRLNAGKLTHLFPARFHLSPDGSRLAYANLDTFETAADREAMQIARAHRLQIQPVLDNDGGNGFDPASVHRLLADPSARTAFIAKVVQQLTWVRFDGLNVDFENLSEEDAAMMGPFLQEFARALHGAGMQLSADVTADMPASELASWSSACDFVVLMAYDEHSGAGPAGPIASFGWFRAQLERAAASVPHDKLVIGVANYAYDWAAGAAEGKSLSYRQAVFALADHRPNDVPNVVVDFDPSSLNSTGAYEDEKGVHHEVWVLDAVSAGDQWSAARLTGARGAALWALGSEDPGVWSFLDRRRLGRPVDFGAMSKIEIPIDAEAGGEGEIYKIAATPTTGVRHLDVDPRTGICLDESYYRLPTVYQVRRTGKADKTLALTFDDGPSEKYTAAVLDKLRDLRVPAAFFVVGKNALEHPELLRRMWAEGHEIGNHSFTHPDPARVSENNFRLEINATQRAVQSITGRSTLLLRPPYNGGPTLLDEVKPMTIASRLGYWTIDDSIDPRDWSLVDTHGKAPVERSAKDLADEVIAQVHAGAGNIILLHDAGGDRSRTIAALDLFVPVLLAEGYRFGSVASLIGLSRDEMMPAVRAEDAVPLSAASAVFLAQRWWSTGLNGCVALAISLVTLRWVGLTLLAWLHRRRDRLPRAGAGRRLTVSVIISAYNEEKVINRTIDTVLASGYEGLEVVVVDDGSKDGTSAEVHRRFAGHPKVTLIRQENAGKSTALNRGMAACRGEILICLDADTLLAPDAVGLMAACFADPAVGAAAGNVKICNAQNTLTRCQLIEYITNQNLERRAYEMLNAVTVVPGAVGAWRRSVVAAVGGYGDDTLAEDMDLTWRIRRAGWKIVTESRAMGYTEAPETLAALYTQRSRWTY
ncbi:MAG: glycosyltransferase, partial [Elusimicrobiota bacterium]